VSYPDLVPFGWSDRWAALFTTATSASATSASASASPGHDGAASTGGADPVPGRVVRHDGAGLLVALPGGVRPLVLSRALDPPPAVGDWLVVAGDRPLAVLDRTGLLTRRAAGGDRPQAIAANVDGVLVVCGLDRPVKAGRIDRVATLAWDAGAVPAVVLTKADLCPDPGAAVAAAEAAHPGLDVVATSAATLAGIDAVRGIIGGRTVALVGESGAGKSSLANSLLGADVIATGRVRAVDAKGRHTTTARHAHPLPGGGVLVDTPGLRAVGLWADPDAVAATYADVDDLAAACRFTDCRHRGEPGCAVLAAVDDGSLAAGRLAGWRALVREAESAARRADPHAQRIYNRRFGRMTREATRRKRGM
jgi:ribosome biogenesis GTPase